MLTTYPRHLAAFAGPPRSESNPLIKTVAQTSLIAAAGLMATKDYRSWRALGEGGLPSNPLGWAGAWFISLAARETTGTWRHERNVGTPKDHARLTTLLPRNGPRPHTARWPVPHRQVDQIASTGMRQALDELVSGTVDRRTDIVTFRTSTYEKHGPAVTLRYPMLDTQTPVAAAARSDTCTTAMAHCT